MPVEFKEGDIVSFLDEVGGGTILAVQESGLVLVLTNDGFRIPVLSSNLVIRTPSIESDLLKVSDEQVKEIKRQEGADPKKVRIKYTNPSGKKNKRDRESESTVEVDLHIHEILDNERGMSSGDKLNYQLRFFERMLNKAIDDKKRKMLVIHGVGEGRLRDEVHNVLRHYPGVRFRDADPRRFGNGATEVELLAY